ncbi:hypothetical protein EV1_029187 [Malus domestica]
MALHGEALLFGDGACERLLRLLELFDQSNDVELGFDLDFFVWIMRFYMEGHRVIVARNLLTPRDNMFFSRRSNMLAIQDSLAFSVQCAGFVSNMGQHLLAQTCQVESLTAEVANLRQEIRQLKRENIKLHMLANNYSMSIKRKLDHLLESEGRIQSDHQRFVAIFQRHFLPSPFGV